MVQGKVAYVSPRYHPQHSLQLLAEIRSRRLESLHEFTILLNAGKLLSDYTLAPKDCNVQPVIEAENEIVTENTTLFIKVVPSDVSRSELKEVSFS